MLDTDSGIFDRMRFDHAIELIQKLNLKDPQNHQHNRTE